MKVRASLVRVCFAAAVIVTSRVPASAQFYAQHNLVSDGAVEADLVDQSLVNAWGLASSATSPWWVANNGTDTSTLYNGSTGAKVDLTVNVPGAPTGLVFSGGPGFLVSDGVNSAPAIFIFATEEGKILGWNPALPPPPPSTEVHVGVDNSANGAVYKGLAIAQTNTGTFLYATNFRAATVEVYDSNWNVIPGGFQDPDIPEGFAPFGIQTLNGLVYVTYAMQDEEKEDDVAGKGLGFVDAFDTAGHLMRRIASGGPLNAPWGLALAPDGFGKYSGDLLVGNFGDGRINAFDPTKFRAHGEFQKRGFLHSTDGSPLAIDGLWAIAFGNGAGAGSKTTLFFTAGPLDEEHGLFGELIAVRPQNK